MRESLLRVMTFLCVVGAVFGLLLGEPVANHHQGWGDAVEVVE